MRYTITPKETVYAGYRFRSRLEARWAAFFDLLGWKWDYEPIDFGTWSPDFAIYGNQTVYVEVKPITDFSNEVAEKINGSGCVKPALIVGATCPLKDALESCSSFQELPQLGWIGERMPDEFEFGDAAFGTWDEKRIGFCDPDQSWTDYVTGTYGKFYRNRLPVSVRHCWASATNRVRFEVRRGGQ